MATKHNDTLKRAVLTLSTCCVRLAATLSRVHPGDLAESCERQVKTAVRDIADALATEEG